MLWYKAWLDTRWRFLAGLLILACGAATIVSTYPKVVELMASLPAMDSGGALGQRIREAAALGREYRGFIWSQWWRQTPTQIGTLFAVLLGTGGLVSQSSGVATLFTLSLPVSRNRLLATRAGAGLAEWFALALISSMVIPLLSPAIGQTYSIWSALVHALCLFMAGTVFFSLALLLSTVFSDLWRPLLMGCGVALALASFEMVVRDTWPYTLFRVMSGELFFRTGRLPWVGLFSSAAISAAMLYLAAVNFARRDF